MEEQTPEQILALQNLRTRLAASLLIEETSQQKNLAGEETIPPLSINETIVLRKRLQRSLAEKEEDLRTTRERLEKSIQERRYCDPTKIRHEAYLIDINNYFMIPEHDRLYIDHNDYERYFFKLNIGYEYTSISKILEESSPRLALLVFNYFGNRPYRDRYGFGSYGWQMFGKFALTGVSEQHSANASNPQTELAQRTLGIDIAAFAPVYRHKIRPDLTHQFGPILSAGASQTDLTNQIKVRSYAGIRSAMNPEHFIDVIMGQTPGLDSVRMEFRGQLPVARLGKDSRMYVGAIANMGVYKKQADENDLFTLYFSWNIDFLNLFTTGG